MKNKKQPTSATQDLNAFRVRITKNSATLESLSKNWKVSFSSDTKQYYFIVMLYKEENWSVLESMANCIFTCSVFGVIDAKFILETRPLFENCMERLVEMAQEPSDETEEEILKQEKLKQEYKENANREN